MVKKSKGKQKQDEKPSGNNATAFQPTQVSEGANVPVTNIDDKSPSIHQAPIQQESQATSWGSSTGEAWGSSAEPAIGGDTWGAGTNVDDGWSHTDSLLEPPPVHSHTILPTIHEQSSSGHFTQGRTESDLGSEAIYSEDDYGQETHRGLHSPQSRTGTATAAPSLMGSPRPPPTVSLTQAAAEAAKMNHNHLSHASEAARKLEESRTRRNDLSTGANSIAATPAGRSASLVPALPEATKISTASAYAALHEKKYAPSPPKPAQPSVSAVKNTWQYRPIDPGKEHIPLIPTDPSWIMTGGNAWSNKHRASKSASAVPNRAHVDEEAWNQHLNHYRQAQQMQQAMHDKKARQAPQVQHRPQHNKHHSHPGHPGHPGHTGHPGQQQQHQQRRPPAQQNQSWQGWGKGEWDEDDEEEDYPESDAETVDAWETAAQHADAWGAQPAKFNEGKREQGRAPGKNVEEQWGQADAWGQAPGEGGGWGQEAGEANSWGDGAGWGQQGRQPHQHQQHQQHQHQQQQHQQQHQHHQQQHQHHQQHQQHQHHQQKTKPAQRDHPGQENEWGQANEGWGKESSGWGKADEGGWGSTGGGAGDWGAGAGTGDWAASAGAGDWAAAGARNSKSEWPITTKQHQSRVTINAADTSGSRNAVSAQQRSQILNSLLNNAQSQKHSAGNAGQLHAAALAAAAQKGQLKQKAQHDKWGEAWEAEDDGWGSLDDDDEYDGNRRVRFSPKTSDIWGGSPRSVPSKTLAHAQQGIATTPINDASNVRFVESRGAAFAFVSNAFFGNGRFARERIHWMFPSDKDKRVASMLAWVQKMSFNIGTYGLLKFLQTRERGALFLNTIFRMHQFPQDPAFDWLTFNQLQGTMDKTLQESVAFYDPARLVIVFVYLPSQTGNSVAIWRIKVNVPDNARLKYQQEVAAITKTLRKDKEYIVMVDELPHKPKVPQKGGLLRKNSLPKSKSNKKNLPYTPNVKPGAKEKRKWWKIFS